MTFGLSKSNSNTVKSKQDTSDAAILVHTDDNNKEYFAELVQQAKLLNARFEEAFRTNIDKEDTTRHED